MIVRSAFDSQESLDLELWASSSRVRIRVSERYGKASAVFGPLELRAVAVECLRLAEVLEASSG